MNLALGSFTEGIAAMYFRFSRRFTSKSQLCGDILIQHLSQEVLNRESLFCSSSFISTFLMNFLFLKYRKRRETPEELTGITRMVAFMVHQDSHERSLKLGLKGERSESTPVQTG